ncbi:hypothetical protein SAMN05428944_1873 [Streptomyces sp. 1222.5]|nr:hypothetical protein BX260_6219 [Streptomyces sp. 5112.2]SEB92785.1 hypothetical protein SAMN05428944_1873 [Streptomyces sp. 1222.5]
MPYSAAAHPPAGLASARAALVPSSGRGRHDHLSGPRSAVERRRLRAARRGSDVPAPAQPPAPRLLARGSRGSVAESRAAASGEDAREPSPEVRPGRLAVAVRQPGFSVVVSEAAALEGCGFGSSPGWRRRRLPHAAPAPRAVRGDGFGWPGFDGALPPAVGGITGAGAGFTGLLVHPHERHWDVTRRLREPLLSERQASLGVALADRADEPIVASLRSWRRKGVGNVRGPADGAVSLALIPPWIRWSP